MSKDDLELYGDQKIASFDAPIPKWLIATYIIVFLIGIMWLYMFWEGSCGWFDRGYWFELQKAANTTYPWHDADMPKNP